MSTDHPNVGRIAVVLHPHRDNDDPDAERRRRGIGVISAWCDRNDAHPGGQAIITLASGTSVVVPTHLVEILDKSNP